MVKLNIIPTKILKLLNKNIPNPLASLFIRVKKLNMSYELQVTSSNPRVASWKSTKDEFKSTNYVFKSTSYVFKSTGYEFKLTSHYFKTTSYEPRVQNHELQVQIQELGD